MSYLALLFCQDEKTARTVTQVLNELEFQVEPCTETFAAVKKLTTQAFEAVVVDCQNEENASLLLKTARNSASNQTSLMVALVEGQAGVAAAFRIGANLVLTKPIAVEQARGTLRVARGLLRKNIGTPSAPGVSPSAPTAPVPTPVPPAAAAPVVTRAAAVPAPMPPSRPIPPPQFSAPASTTAAATGFAPTPASSTPQRGNSGIPVPPSALRAIAASSNLQSEAEPQPSPDAASAGLLEALQFKTFEAAPASPFPASATEIVSVSEVATGANEAVRSALAPRPPMSSQEFSAGFGAATAAAPARELPKPVPVTPSDVADLFEAPVFGQTGGQTSSQTSGPASSTVHGNTGPAAISQISAAPAFSTETAEPETEPAFTGATTSSRSKAPLLAIVALLALAGAGYFGWTQMHKPAVAATPTAGPLQPPPPDFGAADATPPAPAPAPVAAAPATADPSQAPVEQVNRFARPSKAESQIAANQVRINQVTTPVAIAPSRTPSPATPLQVKTELQRSQSSNAQASPQDSGEAPSLANLGTSSKPDALNTIAHSRVAMPSAPTNQRISQGVSDGLLLKRIQPVYPQQAMQMHTQGMVSLTATIAKDGSVKNVKAVSGPAILARAASDAVRQWKYRPYMLNGEPIEVQTEININFVPPR